MKYTLSQAAEATGKNKTTIQRAIKNGRISASKNDTGAYQIDPSELHRVFPIATTQQTESNESQQEATPKETSNLERIVDLEKEVAVLQERNAGLVEQKEQLSETVSDLRKRLDSADGRITALLQDHRPQDHRERQKSFLGIFKRR